MALKDTILGKENTNNSIELACGLGGGDQFFGNLKRNYESNVVNRELRDRVLGNIEESRLAREALNYSEFAKFENSLKGVRNPKLDEIKTLIKNGEVKGKNIISQIDENTQIVFRNDTGVNAHPVKPKGYVDPVDHYNVEIQTKTPAGKWKSKWSYHIVFDENGNIIDTFD